MKKGILLVMSLIRALFGRAGNKKSTLSEEPCELAKYPGVEESLEIEGVRIVFIDEGEGEPILFIHGLSGDIAEWNDQIGYFKKNYRVLALDLPGHGKSDKRNDIPYGRELFTKVAHEFLKARGVDQAVVVGNSMGGMIAASLTLAHSEQIKKLVLCDAAGVTPLKGFFKWIANKLTPKMTLKYWANPKSIAKNSSGAYAHPENYPQYRIRDDIALVQQPDVAEYAYAVTASLKDTMAVDLRPELHKVTCPTLVIWGEKDPLMGPKGAAIWIKYIPHGKMVVIKDSGHIPMSESPEIFNSTVEEFIAGN